MNKYEKEVQQAFLNNEEAVIKRLKQVYGQSLKDIEKKAKELQDQITGLQAALDTVEDAKEKERLKSMIQSKVYQKQYQDALKKQVGSILDNMQVEEFKTVSEYLQKCYEEGFVGSMYSLQQQGIPLCFPLDQTAMVRAVQLDSKISQGLYARLGEDVSMLKKKITAQVSRGIATGMGWQMVAKQLAAESNIGYNNAIRIARTEGHRIQVQGTMEACYKAKEKGADVVKQWDATLDGRTRESHQSVDGEIRELDEKFSNGLRYPGDPHGAAAEVVNCRCALLQRGRWALDDDELQTLKDRAEYFGLDKTKDFEDYKTKYRASAKTAEMRQFGEGATPPNEYDGVFDDFAELKLSKSESEALSIVWSKAKETGNEYGVVIEKGVVSAPVTSNLPDAVKVQLDGYGNKLTVLHSHTNATPPSSADFQRLLDKQVDKIGVIGYNADAYIAYIGDGETPSIEDFLETTKAIADSVTNEMIDHPNFFDWSIEERNYMAIREQAFRIAQQFGWTLEGGRIDVG